MCGFVLAFNDAGFDLQKHCKSIAHRGPTSTRYYVDERIKCGFNRLAIVDPTPESDQPMIDNERKWLLLFNGEIYNYQILKAELKTKYGYQFHTKSDSEVLMVGLGYEGREFVSKLNGIFAFVFVDLRSYSILAGRDPFGVKPLYFSRRSLSLYFCSESKPLANATGATLDRKSLALLLSSGSVKLGDSIFADVFSVKPNSVLEFKLGRVEEHEGRGMYISESEEAIPEEKVMELIATAIKRQRPHVEFGLQLSGGIDSTLLLSYLHKSKYFAGTYAVNVDDDEMSEKKWQDMALSCFKTEQSARTINLSKSDFEIDNLRDMLVSADVPFFHPSFVGSTRMASQAYNDGLKVLISGEGADEIFLGYRWFFEDEPVNSIFEYAPIEKLSRFFGVNEPDMSFLNEMDRLEFFQKFYLQRWLARGDLTGMRHSVEVRVPFLDMELVDTLNRICRAYKIKYGAKWILKNHLLKSLPVEFVNRRKRGFDFPLNTWMQNSHLDFLRDNKDLFEIGNEEITMLHKSNDYRDKRLVFTLCSFALWFGR